MASFRVVKRGRLAAGPATWVNTTALVRTVASEKRGVLTGSASRVTRKATRAARAGTVASSRFARVTSIVLMALARSVGLPGRNAAVPLRSRFTNLEMTTAARVLTASPVSVSTAGSWGRGAAGKVRTSCAS